MPDPEKRYLVAWEIDLFATSPREAAEMALAIHRDPHSIATFFEVTAKDEVATHYIDLQEPADA